MADEAFLSDALGVTIDALTLKDEDRAALALAALYTEQIDDDPERLSDLGPKLLATLTALGATPAGRAVKGAPSAKPGGPTALELVQSKARSRRAG
jgi:hypothetical protein